ncbi:hypothetical protein HYX16_05590 [Candidatus Woesearchaeota archaeon]|nr:hypothetical protein [Candidatus Woesearchaeota archaeon]
MKNWRNIFYWVLVIFTVYIIIEIIRKIFGGSLGFEELVIALLIANLGHTFFLHSKIAIMNSKLSEHIGWYKGKKELI